MIEARVGHDERLAPVGGTGGALVPTPTAARLTSTSRPLRRGIASFDRLWLRWRGPLGLVWKQSRPPLDRDGGGRPRHQQRARRGDAPVLRATRSPDGHGADGAPARAASSTR